MRHVVLCAFRDDLPPAEQAQIIVEFAALRQSVSVVRSLEHGENVSPEGLNEGLTHCFVLDFATAADRDAYLVDPAHVAFAARFGPTLAKIVVVDYEPAPPQHD